jgi:hypothetical protein
MWHGKGISVLSPFILVMKPDEVKWVVCSILVSIVAAGLFVQAKAWNNGGYTEPGNVPNFATHDWIALHAVEWLPTSETWWITQNPDSYLLGTELPDNPNPPLGIGDVVLHHVYFSSPGTVSDDSAASRAQTEYGLAQSFLEAGNCSAAALYAGIMTHYISDCAVFGHVLSNETHHGDYEDYVETRTNEYPTDDFSIYLAYDGALSPLNAYAATIKVANDTTYGGGSGLSCVWMDTHYNWSDTSFKNRAGESINLATNAIADVLHTLYATASIKAEICSFDALFKHSNVRMIYPSTEAVKPLGCGAAWVSDWLASMAVSTKLLNVTEGFDTNSGFVNQTSGNPLGIAGTGIISFGGPFVNPIVKRAESDSTPQGDRAPVKFHDEAGTFSFQHSNGSSIPGANLPLSVINNNEDMFVIEVYRDGAARNMMLCYGFGWKGTYAAGKYFHNTAYSGITFYNTSWIIVKWQDTNMDGFVNNPNDGDTYTVIATGP